MDFVKKRFQVNALFNEKFNYCQLVWMCHNQTNNDKIKRVHERYIRKRQICLYASYTSQNSCCRIVKVQLFLQRLFL